MERTNKDKQDSHNNTLLGRNYTLLRHHLPQFPLLSVHTRTGKRTGDGFRKVVLLVTAFIEMFGLQNSCVNTYSVQDDP